MVMMIPFDLANHFKQIIRLQSTTLLLSDIWINRLVLVYQKEQRGLYKITQSSIHKSLKQKPYNDAPAISITDQQPSTH
jgi:hypothetical protein